MVDLPHDHSFDPLVDFDGLWTLELAERYLPIEGAPPARYEATGGKLVMSPRGGSAHSWATTRLAVQLRSPAHAAGHAVYLPLDVRFAPDSWIEPDLVVLTAPVRDLPWIPADKVLMPVEFVSPSSRRRDRIDKPMMAAAAGIPYYLRIEITRRIEVRLLELTDGDYRPIASALPGQLFQAERPFEISFDPADLLEP